MPIELYPSVAKIKRNGVYENLPGFVPETGSAATQQMIATSESSATAQYVHNKGEYFRLNDTLYQAIVKINVGDSIVVGTNCEVAVIGNDLSKIANSIANYELGIATSSHNTGDYFMVAETMYVATADIQVGDNISTSTNCRKAVVGDELSELKTATIYNKESIINDTVPYAVNGTVQQTTSGTVNLTVKQENNRLTLNGESKATSSQATTKILLTDHLEVWNPASTPSTADVYTLPLIKGHKYKIKASVVSGTRNAQSGVGALMFRLFNSTGQVFTMTLAVDANEVEDVYESDGSLVAVRMQWRRLLIATNLVIDLTIQDISINSTTEELNKTNIIVSNIGNSIGYQEGTALAKTSHTDYYWNAESSTAVLTELDDWQADEITVTSGQYLHVTIRGTTSDKQYPVLVTDNNYHIIEHHGERVQESQSLYFVVPEGGTKLLFSHYASTVAYAYPYIINTVRNTSFEGCKMSLLGDSFSAFLGYASTGHEYYPSPNSDVSSVDQIWWKIVADTFGMTPLVMDGWSGACVASGIRSSGYVPCSDPTRCEALDDGTNNPDVVFIASGLNDYSYSESDSQFGTWDGTTALGEQDDLSDYDTSSYKTAYATMIARIQHKYPNAFIICITPWFQKRRSLNTGANYLNAINKSITDYANATREICKIMHVCCIDGTDIGFNRYNYYPTYSQDTAGASTHPTIAGQAQIAKAIIEQMKNIHRLGA